MATPPTGRKPGRAKKPTALKVLHGDGKKNPQRVNRAEPHPTGAVVKPKGMTKLAGELWDELAPPMERCGMLLVTDVPLFVEFCESIVLARVARVRAMQEAAGRLVVQPGAPSPSAVWTRTMSVVSNLGGRFGLTPSDRSGLVMGGGDGGHSSEDLLSG